MQKYPKLLLLCSFSSRLSNPIHYHHLSFNNTFMTLGWGEATCSVILHQYLRYNGSVTMMAGGSGVIIRIVSSGIRIWIQIKKEINSHYNPFSFLPCLSPIFHNDSGSGYDEDGRVRQKYKEPYKKRMSDPIEDPPYTVYYYLYLLLDTPHYSFHPTRCC